jgi:methanesulfonate monooxygenase subunit alpha
LQGTELEVRARRPKAVSFDRRGDISMTSRDDAGWRKQPNVPPAHLVSGLVYHDEGVFAAEREKIFQKVWSLACHESELPGRYDFRSVEIAGTPLVVVRGEDARVRAFINVCSHRGARLVNERSGSARAFTCFYHRWTYDTLGSCINIPRPEGYETSGIRAADHGLREVRTEVKLGLVFVNLDDNAGSLDDYLGGALDPLEEILGTVPLEVFHYQRSEIEANWKAWMETNLDTYHTVMHYLLRKTQVDKERRIRVLPGGHGNTGGMKAAYSKYGDWKSREDSMALPGADVREMRNVHLFPNASIITRGTVVRIDTISPDGPHRTVVECRGLGVKGDTDEQRRQRIEHHNQYWGPLGRNTPEDALAAELCARSYRSGSAHYQLIARDEGLTGQDDAMLRAYYAQWSKLTGLSLSDPRAAAVEQ